MKDRETSGSFIDPDGSIHQIQASVWAPPKELISVADGLVGYISPANFPLQEQLIDSLAQFITGTQTAISEQAAQTAFETAFR